ncbi:MAG TPA: hypothetical protein VLH41_09010 [Thermoanaerobaculia bacterium]|nr:hypothetical protein [Thermoanaerobaculia bacterium]
MEPRLHRLPAVAAAALALTIATVRGEGPPPPPEHCPAIDPPAPAASGTGLRAFRDPATGKLRPPTADELARVREARALAPKQTQVFSTTVLPDGTTSVDLGDAFLFDVVATRGADGATRVECVPRARSRAAARPGAPEQK